MQCTIHLVSQMSHTNHHRLNNVGHTQLPFHWQFIFLSEMLIEFWCGPWYCQSQLGAICTVKGHFTHETESLDHYTSSTLIGGNFKAEPVQVRYFTLCLRDQRSIYVKARWMWGIHGFLRGIEWIMFRGHLVCFQKPPLGGRPNSKPGDHLIPNADDCWFCSTLSCVRTSHE
jgi:hypothetical protein